MPIRAKSVKTDMVRHGLAALLRHGQDVECEDIQGNVMSQRAFEERCALQVDFSHASFIKHHLLHPL